MAAGSARGNRWARDVPERNRTTMARLVAQAMPLLSEALQAEPRLSPACVDLAHVAKLIGDSATRDQAMDHCLAVDPLSWNVRFAWLTSLDPRWRATATGRCWRITRR